MRLGYAILISIACYGCSSKQPKKDPQGATKGTPTPTNTGDVGEGLNFAQVCENLKSNTSLASHIGLVNNLCAAGYLDTLKQSILYTGNGTPNIKVDNVTDLGAASKESKALFTSAMKIPNVNAKSYNNMVKLQVLKTADFKAKSFKYADAVIYELLPGSTDNPARYSYENSSQKPDAIVKYEAETYFIPVSEGKLYAVTTKLTKSLLTLKELTGFQIIVQSKDGVEVYAISDQKFGNSGNHAQTIKKSTDALGNEQKLSFENGQRANEANAFFP